MQYLKSFLFTVFCCTTIATYAQVDLQNFDFNNFKRLECEGKIPDDFILLSSVKYAQEKTKNDAKDDDEREIKDDFYKRSSFAIDDLLLSGKVLFGDPVTQYVNEVADYVLQEDKKLRKELRFYVIKSNITNAFSTDPGMIFVTTGLISQLENEAQLAFVLAHEIAHYTEKHAIENYVEEKRIENELGDDEDEKIKRFSQYSKKNELEADKIGAKRYIEQLDYAPSELMSSFDVLQFSELPFDDIPFEKDFFNIGGNYIPPSLIKDTIREIDLNVDTSIYENSTHPDIDKRRANIAEKYPELEDDQNYYIVYSKEDFMVIRDMCRFQNVYNNLVNRHYEMALYEIYMLKQKYPDNETLDLSLCKAMLGYAMYINENERTEVEEYLSEIEGESYKMFNFFRNLSKRQFLVLTAKICYTKRAEYPHSEIFKALTQTAFDVWLNEGYPKQKDLFPYSYSEITTLIKENEEKKMKATEEEVDTTLTEEEENIEDDYVPSEETKSKYDKIKEQKVDASEFADEYEDAIEYHEPDNFHYYSFNENLEDPQFKEFYNKAEEKNMPEEQDYSNNSMFFPFMLIRPGKKEKKKFFGIDHIVVVNPIFKRWTEKKGNMMFYSEQQLRDYNQMFIQNSLDLDLKVDLLALKEIDETDVNKFNAVSAYNDFIGEVLDHSDYLDENYFSQTEILDNLAQEFGTNKILFPIVFSVREKENFLKLLWMLTGVGIPFVVGDMVTPDDQTAMLYLLLDTETNEILLQDVRFFKSKPNDALLSLHCYDILHQIKTKPKK